MSFPCLSVFSGFHFVFFPRVYINPDVIHRYMYITRYLPLQARCTRVANTRCYILFWDLANDKSRISDDPGYSNDN